jgi:hypothetical protein
MTLEERVTALERLWKLRATHRTRVYDLLDAEPPFDDNYFLLDSDEWCYSKRVKVSALVIAALASLTGETLIPGDVQAGSLSILANSAARPLATSPQDVELTYNPTTGQVTMQTRSGAPLQSLVINAACTTFTGNLTAGNIMAGGDVQTGTLSLSVNPGCQTPSPYDILLTTSPATGCNTTLGPRGFGRGSWLELNFSSVIMAGSVQGACNTLDDGEGGTNIGESALVVNPASGNASASIGLNGFVMVSGNLSCDNVFQVGGMLYAEDGNLTLYGYPAGNGTPPGGLGIGELWVDTATNNVKMNL